jgi:ribosomal protein S12 methylthiotransferase accessory factor
MSYSSEELPLAVLNDSVPRALVAAIEGLDRLSPMLAGPSCMRIEGRQGRLVVRSAGADVEVQAPKALLDRVFALCDGTRTVNELLATIASSAERAELAEFIQFLLERGALIDGNLACVQAVQYGFQFSPFGLAAPAPLTLQIGRRFLWNRDGAPRGLPKASARVAAAPLDEFFERRATQYTFDDKSISATVLHQLLWSAAGVVSLRHPRASNTMPQRTIASAGGMHLLKLYVALRRSVGRYAPGVYRVDCPGARLVALERVSDDVALLPLVFSKPWQLTYATGALFVAADPVVGAMRYRNRSLQYLFMEAGAALHNVALSAPALGLGQATIGGYYERPCAQLLGLAAHELVLGSAIFGVQATKQQLAAVAKAPDIDFAWVNGDSPRYSMGFHMARAKVNTPDDQRPHTWGRDGDPWIAMRKAVAEAIEREGYRQPRRIVEGPMADIAGAIDPSTCIRYDDRQYASAGFPFHRFDPAQIHAWTQGRELSTGRPVQVLAELVFSKAGLAAHGFACPRPFTQVTSSGCAAGLDAEDATHRALREVIERDAFMRHWLAQTPGSIVTSGQWPSPIRRRMQAIEATGCRVCLQQLASDWSSVALVAVQHEGEHFTTLGMAAADSFARAAEGALDEAEARVYAWLHGHRPTIQRPEQVSTTEHHFELYGLKHHFRRADRVLFPSLAAATPRWPRARRPLSLTDRVQRLVRAGYAPIAVDITPDAHCVDQGRTPLAVAKVLVPGLLPISFGFGKEPFGMVSRVQAGARFPHPFP